MSIQHFFPLLDSLPGIIDEYVHILHWALSFSESKDYVRCFFSSSSHPTPTPSAQQLLYIYKQDQ